jgi:DNA polymerase III delta prime subunit
MAVILPSSITLNSPPGEREIFRRLRDDPETDAWIVLHSLDIADHISQISGELDFVIIIPHKGVVCVEVKSHASIQCLSGNWFYGKNSEPDSRGPFKQAANAMHSIRNYLIKKRPDMSNIVFWSAVIFPYASGKLISGEWHSWQLIDRSRFSSLPISGIILSVIENARNFLSSKRSVWFHKESDEPYLEQCKEIARILRPDFEFFESPRARRQCLLEELKYYTEEQVLAIDRMERNPRVIFTGPAGTGKTLIALEAVRRSVNAGRKTLFLCFNNLLGRWLKEQTSYMSEEMIKTATIQGFMLEISGLKPSNDEIESRVFWEKELPMAATDVILGKMENSLVFYDELVVDEAQDILSDCYLDILDFVLKGGLAAGRWRFFGDFEKQAIFRRDRIELNDFLNIRSGKAPEYALRENCRNTPRIAAYTEILGGLSPGYRKILRPDDQIEPFWRYYEDMNEQKNQLERLLDDLEKEGFQFKDIVLLSPQINSCAAALASEDKWKNRIVPIERRKGNCAGFCTVQAFKGLESPVIILTDIKHFDTENRMNIFYIGITRALQRLAIFVANTAKTDIKELLQ